MNSMVILHSYCSSPEGSYLDMAIFSMVFCTFTRGFSKFRGSCPSNRTAADWTNGTAHLVESRERIHSGGSGHPMDISIFHMKLLFPSISCMMGIMISSLTFLPFISSINSHWILSVRDGEKGEIPPLKALLRQAQMPLAVAASVHVLGVQQWHLTDLGIGTTWPRVKTLYPDEH